MVPTSSDEDLICLVCMKDLKHIDASSPSAHTSKEIVQELGLKKVHTTEYVPQHKQPNSKTLIGLTKDMTLGRNPLNYR